MSPTGLGISPATLGTPSDPCVVKLHTETETEIEVGQAMRVVGFWQRDNWGQEQEEGTVTLVAIWGWAEAQMPHLALAVGHGCGLSTNPSPCQSVVPGSYLAMTWAAQTEVRFCRVVRPLAYAASIWHTRVQHCVGPGHACVHAILSAVTHPFAGLPPFCV